MAKNGTWLKQVALSSLAILKHPGSVARAEKRGLMSACVEQHERAEKLAAVTWVVPDSSKKC